MHLAYQLNAQTIRYKNLIKKTEKEIKNVLTKYKNVSVSFSGGKDSTVLLDLVGKIKSDVIVLFIESGATFPDTHEIINEYKKKYKIVEQKSTYTYQEIFQMREKKKISEQQWMKWLVYEPAQEFIKKYKIELQCIGLRSQESKQREMRFKVYPNERIQKATMSATYYPLKDWKVEDVWTYIEQKKIPYNTLYDKYREIGVPDSLSRVDSYLECEGNGNATLEILEKYYPSIYLFNIKKFPFLI